MTHSTHAITVGRIGSWVEIVVGVSTVRMTLVEAEEMIRAIERAIDPPPHLKPIERVH